MSRATLSATPYSSEFKPTSIAGCQMWLDAADATTFTLSGSIVTQWRDKSGSGNNATPFYTGPTLVQNVRNSLPGLSFSGGNMMKCGAFLTSTNFSAFIVVNNNSGTNVSMGVWKVQYSSYIITDVEIKVGSDLSANNKASVSIPDFTTTHIYGVTLSSSTVPGSTFIYNGSYDGLNTLVTGTSPSGNAATCAQEVSIGGLMESNSPLYMMTGYIHEVIFFSNTLTTNQRQSVEGYLAWKWGIQANLPGGHLHVSAAPTAPNALGITRPAISIALAPTGVRSLGNAPYNAAFLPTSIAGCQLWYDAMDATTITQSSGLVSQLRDKSGNNRHISQATTGNQPSYANNTLTFNGSQYLTNTISSGISGNIFTGYIIYKPTSTIGNQRALFIIDNSSWIMIDNNVVAENANGIGAYTVTTISTTTPTIVAVTSASTYSLNGNAFINLSVAYNQGNPTSINLGSGTSGGVPFNGSIYEVLVYNTVLSLSQHYQVTGYLAWKWGLQASLPQSLAPPFTNPTTIPGCILWLDATDPLGTGVQPANGTTLTTWKDKSVSNFPFTSVGSAYNTTAVNGLPGMTLSTNFIGYDPGSAQNNWQEVFAVGLWTGGSTFNSYNGFVTGSIDSGSDGIILIGNAGSTSWYGSGNGYQTPFLNGTQTGVALPAISTPFQIRTFTGSAVSIRGLRFGIDRSWTDRKWIGFISEVICYNTALTATQRLQIEGYLAWKWGSQGSLVNTHTYYSASPAHSHSAAAPTGANLRPALSAALVPAGVKGVAAFILIKNISLLVTGSTAGAVTNYQIPITVYRTTGTNSGNSVYLGTSIYPDYSNLFFTASNLSTALPFYIESSTVTTTSATIWVSIPSIPASPSTVKVYLCWYPNGIYTSTQSGINTFILFDEFTGSSGGAPNSSIWNLTLKGSGGTGTLTGSGTFQISPVNSTVSSVNLLSVNTLPANNFCIHARRQYTSFSYSDISFAQTNTLQDSDNGGQTNWWHTTLVNGYNLFKQSSTNDFLTVNSSGVACTILNSGFGTTTLNTWELVDFSYTSSGVISWSVNGSQQATATDTSKLTGSKYLLISQGMYSTMTGNSTTLDYIFVRNFVSPEPSVTAWGT